MKVLTQSREIRAAIREVLGDPEDDRVALVAYVGVDAPSFLPTPAGLTLYCWPHVGATNPAAIDDLKRLGVAVHFVDRLHAKVYWSRSRGAVIGSANLTDNALGDEGLQEVAVVVPPGTFDMDAFSRSLPVQKDFDGTLRRLHQAHVRFLQRNPPARRLSHARVRQPSLIEWFAAGKARQEFRMTWYDEVADAPADAVRTLAEETGSRQYQSFYGVERATDLKAGVFTLSFRAKKGPHGLSLSNLKWWVPERVILSGAKPWKRWPFIWFAQRLVPAGARPPFDIREANFKKALTAAIEDRGGKDWLEYAPYIPAKRFLTLLRQHFESGE